MERLEPLGASDEDSCQHCEEEKEMLQTSLFTLTTHFAQVQFRLRQVCDAPFEEQEELLKSLEEFAFTDTHLLDFDDGGVMETVKKKRQQQKELVERLKTQVKELASLDHLFQQLRIKESVEEQLRTQIADLERFIQHLRSVSDGCVCKVKKSQKNYLVEILDRSFAFFQIFALVQFTWGCNCFTLRAEVNHWGDLRAKLELAIIELKKMLKSKENKAKILLSVRKNLSTSIRELMEHGTKSQNLLSNNGSHGWDIILYYYRLKKGDEFNSSTIQKLSRSFSLEIAGVSPESSKQNLLCAIEHIISIHSRYKRSNDSHFKAFVCAALNARRLVTWLTLIFQCGEVIRNFYYPWSYVSSTRYQDGLRSLDVLTRYKFELPVDFDVKRFQIEDNVFV